MPIRVSCECGKTLNVPDAQAGKRGKCPACGRVLHVPMPAPVVEPVGLEPAPIESEPAYEADQAAYDVSESQPPVEAPALQYAAPARGIGGPIAPPTADPIRIPTVLPPKLRRPNLPPVYLVMSTSGADVQADFDCSPVLEAFVEAFAKNVKKKFDVRLETPPADCVDAIVFARVAQINQGNRWLRYFLGLIAALFGASTCVEFDGNVQGASRQPVDFRFKHRCHMGVFGGGSINLLKLDAKIVAKKVAKMARNAR